MAWPPPVLPISRTNADAQQDTHPADHNAANLAINDIVAEVQKRLAQSSVFAVTVALLFDANGLCYTAWDTLLPAGQTWSAVPTITGTAANEFTGADAGINISTFKPHNTTTTLVLMAHYTMDGRMFAGMLTVAVITVGAKA